MNQQNTSEELTGNQTYFVRKHKLSISDDWKLETCSFQDIRTRIQQDFTEDNSRIYDQEYLDYLRDQCLFLITSGSSCESALIAEIRKVKNQLKQSHKNSDSYRYKIEKLDIIKALLTTKKCQKEQKKLMEQYKERNYSFLHQIASIRKENAALESSIRMLSKESESEPSSSNSESNQVTSHFLGNRLISLPEKDEINDFNCIQSIDASLHENENKCTSQDSVQDIHVSGESNPSALPSEDQLPDNFLNYILDENLGNQMRMESMMEMDETREEGFSNEYLQ